MFRAVTIIGLLFSVTVSAAPRGNRNPKNKCEALITTTGLAAEAESLIMQVRETVMSMELRQSLKSSPGSVVRFAATEQDLQGFAFLLAQMTDIAASIESARGNAPAVAERDTLQLRDLVTTHLPKIQAGIALVQADTAELPRTHNFMKREILNHDPMAGW